MTTQRDGTGQRIAVLLGVVALVAGSLGLVRVQDPATRGGPEVTPEPARAAAAPSAAARATSARASADGMVSPTPAAPRSDGIVPTRVRIPAIDVDADVIELGLQDDRTLAVPSDFAHAGWWRGGTRPGADGPAVVVGHVDSRDGPAVFFRLRDLRRGDRIVLVDDAGRRARYRVDRIEQHPKDDFPTDAVYGDTDGPSLRLVTCGGAFDRTARSYVDNVIVFATAAA